jgi:hypothetical protein
MKEELVKNTYKVLIREIQSVITILYVLSIGIGMLFKFQKYSEFGINIFDYADVFDFLTAPFSDFRILLFTIVSMALTYLFFRLDLLWRKKYPKFYSKMNFGWDKKTWYSSFRYFSFSIIFVLYLYLSADKYGNISKVQILKQPPVKIRFPGNEIKKGKMIGKTKDVIFLLDGKKVSAIPLTSMVKELEIE